MSNHLNKLKSATQAELLVAVEGARHAVDANTLAVPANEPQALANMPQTRSFIR